jgi:hypothetical protein
MEIRNTFPLIVIFLSFISCEKIGNNVECFNVDLGIQISVQDVNGNDLLDSTYEGAFKKSDIRLIYEVDRETSEVYNLLTKYPSNLILIEPTETINHYTLGFALNHAMTDGQSITYIKWSETDTDTITTVIQKKPCLVTHSEVAYNNQMMNYSTIGSFRYAKIIK